MRKLISITFSVAFLLTGFLVKAQVGISTNTPDDSSMLDITSTDTGLLIPRMTQAQRTAIGNTEGLLVFQTSNPGRGFWYNNGGTWLPLPPTPPAATGDVWELTGNAGTNDNTNFIGTTNNRRFSLRANGQETITFNSRAGKNRNVGIRTGDPTRTLDISGSIRIQDGNQGNNKVLTSNEDGDATWQDPPGGTGGGGTGSDPDWNFASGSAVTSPIHRTGPVRIGVNAEVDQLDSFDNPAPELVLQIRDPGTAGGFESAGAGTGASVNTGVQIGAAFFTDGVNKYTFFDDIIPTTNGTLDLGASNLKWTVVHARNNINTSDKRLKEDIKPLEYTKSDLQQIKTIQYQWKRERYGDTELRGRQKTNKIGFSAQNLLKILPEAVEDYTWVRDIDTGEHSKKSSERLGVYYQQVLPVVVKSIQEKQELLNKIKQDQREITQLLKNL